MISQYHVDQLGYTSSLPPRPSRIISLVPSQTELLHYLGLSDQVVGITKFCIHPSHWKEEKVIIGGTKKFNFDKIDALQPDLIIGNKEENYPEGIMRLKERYPVWMSDVNTISEALQMIAGIGEITNRKVQASELVNAIKDKFSALERIKSTKRVLYVIWKDPWMVVSSQTFINDMLTMIGFQNCASHFSRYPIIEVDAIKGLNPELILLSTEPFPFTEEHVKELGAKYPNTKVLLVDGEYFSWYGSRLLHAPDYFKNQIVKVANG